MDKITKVETYSLYIPRDEPYLGPLEEGNAPNEKGYFVRPGNKSIYSVHDHSVLVKITTQSGAFGWGECVTVVSPKATQTIIDDLLGPYLIGKNPHDVVKLYEDMYNLMRVRGFFGGFFHDAIAALDIALWDVHAKLLKVQVCTLLGSKRWEKIPAYVSGLPKPKLNERLDLAKSWTDKGFGAIKFASAVSREGILQEVKTLREGLGSKINILCDMHWKFSAAEAINLITKMEAYDLYVAEAPVAPEDMEGQALVVRSVKTQVGIGEELRTIYEYRPRFEKLCMHVLQPEIGRTGITAMWQICQMGKAYNMTVMPHASIGIGIFQAASLQVSVALSNLVYHEYQHSIFDKNLQYITGNMRCEKGFFHLSEEPGLGVAPKEKVFQYTR